MRKRGHFKKFASRVFKFCRSHGHEMDEVSKSTKSSTSQRTNPLALHTSIQSSINPIFNQFNRQDSILSTGSQSSIFHISNPIQPTHDGRTQSHLAPCHGSMEYQTTLQAGGPGHIAKHCKRKQKCGKCGKDHETKEYTSDERKCLQCKGEH
jgi:hypothetical protein